MIGPNLSGWAINARSLTLYFMLVAVIAGAVAFVGLGRDEDPTFTIKTMLVTAIWPGATIEETQNQLTDRLERRLQETTGLDSVRSITRPGVVTIYVDLDGTFPPDRCRRSLAAGPQQHGRYPPYFAARRGRTVLQRRLRRCIWNRLCVHDGRVHPS